MSSPEPKSRHLHVVDASLPPHSGADAPEGPAERSPAPRALDACLGRVATGSIEAFNELYEAMSDAVYGLALKVVRDAEMAEDVAQEALLEVWRNAAGFRPERGSARSWVMTIAHRRAVDRVRREQSVMNRMRDAHAQPHEAPEQPDTIIDSMQSAWEAARVRRALDTLTPLQREAIELAYFRGFSHRQVAAELDIPLGTAKTRLRDGLIRLRDVLEVKA